MRPPLFGLSAAGSRSEGGVNGPGEPQNQWAAWERVGAFAPAGAPARTWSDPDGVLDVAQASGAAVLALSVEWARIEPRPGCVDEGAVDRYAATFAAAAARGLAPIGVLHDLAHPAWLGEEFWLTPGSPDRFAEHAARIAAALSASCRHWVTLRQPNVVALAGWVDGRHPPRRVGALSDAWAVVDNLLAAHLLAYRAIHDVQADAHVLLGLRAAPAYDWHGLMVDLLCAPALGVEPADLDAWVAARRRAHDRAFVPSNLEELASRRMAGATSPFGGGRFRRPSPRRALDLAYLASLASDARKAQADAPNGALGPAPNGALGPARHRDRAYPLDALLVGWQPSRALVAPLRRARTAPPWKARPDPEGLAAWCRARGSATPGLPVWVEDALATEGHAARADGWDRTSYVRAQLGALASLEADEAVTVAGYLCATHVDGGDPTWPEASFGSCPVPDLGSEVG